MYFEGEPWHNDKIAPSCSLCVMSSKHRNSLSARGGKVHTSNPPQTLQWWEPHALGCPLNFEKKGEVYWHRHTSWVRASATAETIALQVARVILQYECNKACEDVLSILRRYMHEKTVCASEWPLCHVACQHKMCWKHGILDAQQIIYSTIVLTIPHMLKDDP